MPVYDYKCGKCRKSFATTESITAHGTKKVHCPSCKSAQVSRVFSAFSVKTSKKS